MTDDARRVPQGALSRFARVAAIGLRSGAGMVLGSDGFAQARHAAEALGTLRGLAAKIGQMASYVDGLVPEGQRDVYQAAMTSLRAAAPASTHDEVRALVRSELGESVDVLFREWNDAPIASASIGQVHRAVLHDGRVVAVKVQHPGIWRAIESDLASAGMLETIVGVAGGRRFNTRAMLDVLRARFREELDYRLEPRRQERFRAFHADDARVVVPAIISDRSAQRVMTSEFVTGIGFDQACSAAEGERVRWCETLWRFVFRGNLEAGMFNADPHPGNYIFQPDGRVAFLDFGCVQEIAEPERLAARRAHSAALAHDVPAFHASAIALLGMRDGSLAKRALDYMTLCFQPLFASPYCITRPYAASLVEEFKKLGLHARKVDAREMFNMPPDMLFLNRLQFGFYSVLARMNVAVDYAAIERAVLHTSAPTTEPLQSTAAS